MTLYLVRHAIAEEQPSQPHLGDDGRVLTPVGREKFVRQVIGLRRLEATFTRVMHSPKLRAVETAQLLAPLSPTTEPLTLLGLPPGPELLNWLAAQPDPSLALVGHQPWLSQLCAWLVIGQPEQETSFPFKKGGVSILEGTPLPGQMQLTAVLPPRVLRELGRA